MMQTLKFHKETRCWRFNEGIKLLYPLYCGDPILIEVDNTPCKPEVRHGMVRKIGENEIYVTSKNSIQRDRYPLIVRRFFHYRQRNYYI